MLPKWSVQEHVVVRRTRLGRNGGASSTLATGKISPGGAAQSQLRGLISRPPQNTLWTSTPNMFLVREVREAPHAGCVAPSGLFATRFRVPTAPVVGYDLPSLRDLDFHAPMKNTSDELSGGPIKSPGLISPHSTSANGTNQKSNNARREES